MLLQGVIDSPDIPLNVSRSYLQGDPNVRKINSHITKKVADKLEEIFKNDRTAFEEKWESLGLFVKYGMMTDDKFLEKANKFLILQDTDGKFYTIEEYRLATEVLQKNKDGKQVILYTTDPVQQDAFIQQAIAKSYVVLKMETIIDNGFVLVVVFNTCKYNSHRRNIDIETVETKGIFKNVNDIFQPLANQKGIAFSIKKEDGVPEVLKTDRIRVILRLTHLDP